jgi:UDP-N-acetyl-D-galactosamine dehydrogenase
LDTHKIAVLGLGYVGLPLAIAFGRKFRVKGFDINSVRIEDLNSGKDFTGEASDEQLQTLLKQYREDDTRPGICFTNEPADLSDCNIFIVTVPTPVNTVNAPDLSQLMEATQKVAVNLKKGNLVIYESTVSRMHGRDCSTDIGTGIRPYIQCGFFLWILTRAD